MYQVPQAIWNGIAKTQQLTIPLWADLFRAKDLPKALEPLYAQLEAAGADARTVRAYLLVAPLLQENVAISRFLETHPGQDSLRSLLPELTTMQEATALASSEYSLRPTQLTTLKRLLEGDWTNPGAGKPSATPPASPPNSATSPT